MLQTSVTVNEEMVQRIEEVRAKVKIAQAEATEDAKLCNRTSTALDYLYSSKDMAKLIKCVKDLGKNASIFICLTHLYLA